MAALRFIDGSEPGYSRQRVGGRWVYLTPAGKVVRNARLISRLENVGLPPAYSDAWYAKRADAHLQATGIDAAGRKQYRYHPEFRRLRDQEKFERMAEFGSRLSGIRIAVARDLARRDLCRQRVVAAVIRLLDAGRIRVGNQSYARANRTYGATTLRNRHARVSGCKVSLIYVGKGGVRHRIGINDARLARIIKRCQDLPGQLLFKYCDENGVLHPVTSGDVNGWLRENGAADFTAKDFRTWGASVLAFAYLAQNGGRGRVGAMLKYVSARLGNTPAVARKSYIHPALIEAAHEPQDVAWRLPRPTKWLSREERGLIALLK